MLVFTQYIAASQNRPLVQLDNANAESSNTERLLSQLKSVAVFVVPRRQCWSEQVLNVLAGHGPEVCGRIRGGVFHPPVSGTMFLGKDPPLSHEGRSWLYGPHYKKKKKYRYDKGRVTHDSDQLSL